MRFLEARLLPFSVQSPFQPRSPIANEFVTRKKEGEDCLRVSYL
jgi:hypothetical protein